MKSIITISMMKNLMEKYIRSSPNMLRKIIKNQALILNIAQKKNTIFYLEIFVFLKISMKIYLNIKNMEFNGFMNYGMMDGEEC